jgi:outer membrane protein TolC
MTLLTLLRRAVVPASLLAAPAAQAQVPAPALPIPLAAALRRADSVAFGNRIARGTAQAQHAAALEPLRGILPSVHAEAGYLQTTDPIGAFGTILRQRSATPASFDPHALNFPSAARDYAGAIVAEQPLLNADAWAGRRAAMLGAQSADAGATWTRLGLRADVVRAYYGVMVADAQVSALDSAARAAHAHARTADAMVRNGLATRSDALLASVRAGDLDAQQSQADADARIARRQLAALLALDDTPIAVDGALPSSDALRALVAADTMPTAPAARADLDAASLQQQAAAAAVRRAQAEYLPRVNAFGRYDWHGASRVYDGLPSWTAGVMVSWAPFSGASELSDVHKAQADRAVADAALAAARAGASVDLERTRLTLVVALQRMAIADRAAEQASEAHRIVTRKYEGGLATIAELLDAAAADARASVERAASRYAVIAAAADRRLALGADPGSLAALDHTTTSMLR